MAKGWVNEFERHSLARQGIKTAVPRTTPSGYKIPSASLNPTSSSHGGRLFKLNNHVVVDAWYEKTRNAFRHMAVVYKDGVEVYRTKIPYQNRTWESYDFQSVLQKAIDGVGEYVLSSEEKKKAQEYARDGLEKQEHERVEKEFGRIGALAQMGEIMGRNTKEKNDWKERMLKAGLGNKGLQMPEDWDSLSEETKEARLNAVIGQMKKK
jgi:hypothetical protein